MDLIFWWNDYIKYIDNRNEITTKIKSILPTITLSDFEDYVVPYLESPYNIEDQFNDQFYDYCFLVSTDDKITDYFTPPEYHELTCYAPITSPYVVDVIFKNKYTNKIKCLSQITDTSLFSYFMNKTNQIDLIDFVFCYKSISRNVKILDNEMFKWITYKFMSKYPQLLFGLLEKCCERKFNDRILHLLDQYSEKMKKHYGVRDFNLKLVKLALKNNKLFILDFTNYSDETKTILNFINQTFFSK